MRNRLIIEGNTVYELDEECLKKKQGKSAGGCGQGNSPQAGKPQGQGRP